MSSLTFNLIFTTVLLMPCFQSPAVDEVKSLKTQVVSLGNELRSVNDKQRAVDELYRRQKERQVS